MAKKKTEEQILKDASEEAKLWVDNFTLDGKYDGKAVLEQLAKRTYKSQPVYAMVVDGPDEAAQAVEEGVADIMGLDLSKKKDAKKVKEKIKELRPDLCVWDYYLMAFYESAYHQLPEQNDEFMNQSLFEAYKAGLGHLINLGGFIVGVLRPEAYRDAELRLHREDGPAIIWGSYRAWYWHQVEVEQKWIEKPDECTKKDFTGIQNQEKKRAFCEILGWERVLDMLGSKKISSDDWGDLIEAQLDDDNGRPARFADVRCPSTGRRYLIRTEPDMESCGKALARSGKFDSVEDYNFVQET